MTSEGSRESCQRPPVIVYIPNNEANDYDDDVGVCLSPGYKSYSETLTIPLPLLEYDSATSHDDLSADEAFDIAIGGAANKNSHWKKVKNVVQWAPFVHTYKRHKYPWVQLAGHQGNFQAGSQPGTIMKKLCVSEQRALQILMDDDPLKPYVPKLLGIEKGAEDEDYLQLEDLLYDFTSPCVMDIKMGVRTYLEDDLAKARQNPKLRKDMYAKMVQVDSSAPTASEHQAKAITKPRYMVWRETISSTATLGFRIEGVRMSDGTSSKDFKTTRTKTQVLEALDSFIGPSFGALVEYIERLKEIRLKLNISPFFKSHEFIGSSLLFVHSDCKSGLWLIDFAKTVSLPLGTEVTHDVPWTEGSHEDGYLIGLNNLIDLLEMLKKKKIAQESQDTSQEFHEKSQEFHEKSQRNQPRSAENLNKSRENPQLFLEKTQKDHQRLQENP